MQCLSDYLSTSKNAIPFFALTETHLKSHHYDAEVMVDGYKIVRADRSLRRQGGSAIYIHQDLTITDTVSHSNSFCETAAAFIQEMNLVVVAIYRPPGAPQKLFEESLSVIEKFISPLNSPEVLILGDFNFPFIKWDPINVNPEKKGITTSDRNSAYSFLEFLEDHYLQQFVMENTRKDKSILDLVISNNHQSILSIDIEKTVMSDHDIVHCGLNYKNPLLKCSPRTPSELHKFDTLNFNKADWPPIDDKLSLVDWQDKFSTASVEESQKIFEDTVFDICAAHTPVKGPKSSEDRKPYVTKHRRILIRRKKKLSAKINCFKEKGCKQVLIDQLYKKKFDLELQIRDQIQAERNQLELEAILKIRENPKAFFTYAKKFQKTKEGIGPLRDGDGDLQSDPKIISELLKTQYSKAFSSPKKEYPPLPRKSPKKGKKFSLEDITFFEEDIIAAIASVGTYSAVGPDKFPAIILKKCSKTLASPLASMLRSSLDQGIIPSAYKKQSIVPIYKKGNKDNPANYRPVSLTSHIIKVFERVILHKMVKYRETNNLLKKTNMVFGRVEIA